jgi:ZIP family zinc transporter
VNNAWQILMISLLPAAGNFAGSLIAEATRVSAGLLNLALHVASGIMIAIVAVELIPRTLDALSGVWIAVAFAAGGSLYVVVRRVLEERQGTNNSEAGTTRMWMIYIAVAVDLTTDGLLIGSASAMSFGLGLTLAAGQVLADVPEGYAAMANFREKGLPGRRRILLSLSFFPFVILPALLSFWLLREAGAAEKSAALAVVARLLTVAAVEDMLEEAHSSARIPAGRCWHSSQDSRFSPCYPRVWGRWLAKDRAGYSVAKSCNSGDLPVDVTPTRISPL